MAIAGVLNPAAFAEEASARQAADDVAARLDALSSELERGWQGRISDEGGVVFTRTLRGVTEMRVVDGDLLRGSEARRLDGIAKDLKVLYDAPGTLSHKDSEWPVTGPVALSERVMEISRKGMAIQRYKGLGEMNPDQLWETTLDPDVRSLLQVRVSHVDEAEDVFSTLMGDLVEPRREFIQQNALKVANLDI